MTKRFTLAVALFLLPASSGAVAPSLQAQEPIRVSTDVVCAECVITIDTVLTLGGLDGEGMEAIHETLTIVVDARRTHPDRERLASANLRLRHGRQVPSHGRETRRGARRVFHDDQPHQRGARGTSTSSRSTADELCLITISSSSGATASPARCIIRS